MQLMPWIDSPSVTSDKNCMKKKTCKHRSCNKVNRCLARYSPRSTTTNQPTNRIPNEPERPICAQESIFWARFGRFGAKNPTFDGRKLKFLYPFIGKTGYFFIYTTFCGRGESMVRIKMWTFFRTQTKIRFFCFFQLCLIGSWKLALFHIDTMRSKVPKWGSFCLKNDPIFHSSRPHIRRAHKMLNNL